MGEQEGNAQKILPPCIRLNRRIPSSYDCRIRNQFTVQGSGQGEGFRGRGMIGRGLQTGKRPPDVLVPLDVAASCETVGSLSSRDTDNGRIAREDRRLLLPADHQTDG